MVTNDTLLTKEDRSGYVSAPVDTIFTDANPEDTTTTSDTSYVYRKYETVTSMDTLYYTEVIDTTLKYKFNCQLDSKDSIGKRYRRQDAIGTPLCITVDYDSLEDNSVTVRNRDNMSQERVKVDNLISFIDDKTSLINLLKKSS